MLKISLDDFVCPECNKKPGISRALIIRKWSVRSLSLPYFVCINCCACGYDKRFIRNHISRWRNDDSSIFGAKRYSFKEIYDEAGGFLEKIMSDSIERLGYHRTYFKHISPTQE